MTALPEVRRESRLGKAPPANFDEWEAWIDSDDPQPWFNADPPRAAPPRAHLRLVEPRSVDLTEARREDPPLHVAVHIDLVAGEFFRGKWRRRLADAEGDYGHVARQMRKAGVPLNLALAILLMPEELLLAVQT